MEEIEKKGFEFEDLKNSIKELYEIRSQENILSHRTEFNDEIEMLSNLKINFFVLSMIIVEEDEIEKHKGRIFFCKRYLDVIANNFKVSKSLFEQGFHIQLQLIFRNQFEFINILIAFMGDEEYFLKYVRTNENSQTILTPKPINTEKTIKKIMQVRLSGTLNSFWKDFQEIMNFNYSQLSIIAHGNIPYVAMQSMEGIKDDNEKININCCGVLYPLSNTNSMLTQMLKYFQLARTILFIILEEEKLLDKDSEFYNLAKI